MDKKSSQCLRTYRTYVTCPILVLPLSRLLHPMTAIIAHSAIKVKYQKQCILNATFKTKFKKNKWFGIVNAIARDVPTIGNEQERKRETGGASTRQPATWQ